MTGEQAARLQASAPTLFVVILTYVAPIEQIDAAGADHVAWLQRGYDEGALLMSGRRIPRTGGVIIARGSTLAAVQRRMRDDPFQQRGLATAEIFPFEAVMLSPAMHRALFNEVTDQGEDHVQ